MLDDKQADSLVMEALVDDQRMWSDDEIVREIGREARDSLNRLYGGGLIHRLDGYAWATRAAIKAREVEM
jgi:hypothetical protein